MAKTQIKNYSFKPGIGRNDNLFSNAFDLIALNREFIVQETIAYVESEYSFASYALDSSQLEQDVRQNLQAVLQDLRYGGNSNTFDKASQYWEQDTAQISGTRASETETIVFIRDLVLDFILDNQEYDAQNVLENQVIDTEKNPDPAADAIITELFGILSSVLENGLSVLPTQEPVGVGHIIIQGQYDLEDILLITNVTKNEIIFNFADPATGGTVDLQKRGESEEFAAYLQITDAITKITLNYDTSNHDASDELQIFIEFSENGKSVVTTRPFDFGTDAIERMRVATPYSMLDADFEYGLQTTKWSAIGTMRGYPSVYEVPGTDTAVSSITTDASSETEGVGQSLLTVNTVTRHGFESGTPITIKGLNDAIAGSARAEGSFIVTEILSETEFTYFAKSKVGDTNGERVDTAFTQLREAGFYTGASIGNPEFLIASQGSAGTLVAELNVQPGEDRIPYDGPNPEIGAPLVNAAIPTGSQVTDVISTSAGGGVYITPKVIGDYASNTFTITVDDASGTIAGLATDDGVGNAIFLNSIANNDITFSNPFTQPVIGNSTVYTNVVGSNVASVGNGAEFTVSKESGLYTVTLDQAGTGYAQGDRILITGDQVGGLSPDHDLTVIVESVNEATGIETFIFEGTAFDGTGTVSATETEVDGGEGNGAQFDISYSDNSYDSADITSPDLSENYTVNDVINISGSLFPGGVSPANDATIKVTAVGTGGAITGTTISGVAPDAQVFYNNVPFSYTGTGTGLELNVEKNGTVYSVNFTDPGLNFQNNDEITVSGADLGGSTPENDLVITITGTDVDGRISDFVLSGSANNANTVSDIIGNNVIGTGAEFDVDIAAESYTGVSPTLLGQDYATGQTITVPGDQLLGSTPENDLVIEITAVDSDGGITTAVVSSGVAVADAQTFTAVAGENELAIGSNALFDITRDNEEYSVTVVNAGQDYKVGNRIQFFGSQLGGTNNVNDLLLRILSTSAGGEIATFAVEYSSAAAGIELDLISTITMSENLASTLSKDSLIDYELLATIEIEFDSAHGLVPGDTFIVDVDSNSETNGHLLATGSFFVSQVPSVTSLRYTARAPGFIETDGGSDPIGGEVYSRPDSFFVHRPFDGGVQLGTGGPQHGASAVRQSKKYIRYQSGKGIMYTTGALFAPSYDLRSVTAEDVEVNSLITITTDDNDHGVQEGGIIRLLGVETPGYNSGPETAIPPEFDYEVVNVIDERTFQVRSQRRLGSTTATLGFGAQMSVIAWHGATVRSGIFDDQNGIFWEYDGTQISVVQRTSTFQIAGTLALQVDNNVITGTNTRFRDQLRAGDKIVVKGMTHVISHVNDQSEMTVTPDWRGVVDVPAAKGMLVRDKKIKQADFNIDRLDGTGPSGYDIDIAKMQMIGIQYSWYGAGFIDFMVRGADGNFVYAHRMRNSNVNTEAFMRSGNLPVRYEVTNEGPPGKLVATLGAGDSEIFLEDSSFFPEQGTLYIDNEIIRYTGKNDADNKLTGLQRAATLSSFQAGATRTYSAGFAESHADRTGVILISNTITPLISHWGSAFITDGQFDDDRGYIFSYVESGIPVSTTQQTAFMLRLAPSVSNSLVGDLGERELLNRAQLLLQGIEITSNDEDNSTSIQGGIVVEGILNPQNYPIDPGSVRWSGLSGVSQGGQPSFAQIASGGAIDWTTSDEIITELVPGQASLQDTANIRFNRTNTSIVDITNASATDVNPQVGDFVVGTTSTANFGSGIRIRLIRRFSSTTRLYLDSSYSGTTAGSVTIERRFNTSNRNFVFLNQQSAVTAGITPGTSVTGGNVTFPAGTEIVSITEEEFGETTFLRVTFNNTYSGTFDVSSELEFEFSQPPYGEPGETVFSFIAQPGERSELSLDSLKELTNTPLGGRGTFPNGPDVLAINVYKVSGAQTEANVIIKWGEAQA